MTIKRADCAALDANDPLAYVRTRFVLPEGVSYLDGNSLGAMPRGVSDHIAKVIGQDWGIGLIRSWNQAGWFDAPARIGAKLAPILGAEPHQVIVTDTISINLFKMLVAAARMRPGRNKIVAESGNFPSDNYIVDSAARMLGMRVRRAAAGSIAEAIDDDTAVVELSHISYRTAEILDMAAITAAAHANGALVVWDLAHSTGAVALHLDACNVDFAVGCGYKYLNGGPGAPSHVYVAARHHANLDQPLTGWFAHRAPFEFGPDFVAANGTKAMLCSTPPVLSLLALEAALDAFDGLDMADVQAKGRALGDLMIKLFDERLAILGFGLSVARDGSRRGNHVSVTHSESYRIMQALIARGVIGDFRAPDVMRFGFGPLYTRFVDVFDAVVAIEDIMQSKAWAAISLPDPGTVT